MTRACQGLLFSASVFLKHILETEEQTEDGEL
jgi:hypothetical protein